MSIQRPPDFRALALAELERQQQESWQRQRADAAHRQHRIDQDAAAQQQQLIEQERIRLEGLQQAYAQRNQRAGELIALLAEWITLDQQLSEQDRLIGGRLIGQWGSMAHGSRFQELRRAAGLQPMHAALMVPAPRTEAERKAKKALEDIAGASATWLG